MSQTQVTSMDASNEHVVPTFYGVYMLQSIQKPNSIYIGSTPDPYRRLRQHNGDLRNTGAFRTKRDGYRPWRMALIVSGFPSKVSALQFEHAFQHPHTTRHIGNRIASKSQNQRSIACKLGNLRLLLNSSYFSALNLQVNIFTDQFDKLWYENKYQIPVENTAHTWSDFDSFVACLPDFYSLESHIKDLKSQLVSVDYCNGCDKEIDIVLQQEQGQIPLVTRCLECHGVFHLTCFTIELLPRFVNCPKCNERMEWYKLAAIATRIRKGFNS